MIDGVTVEWPDNTDDTPLREATNEVLRCLNAVLITPAMVLAGEGKVS